MKQTTANRLLAVVVVLVLFVSYVFSRDTIRVHDDFSPSELREIVTGIRKWSTPKFFRHIEIERGTEFQSDKVIARVREPGGRWSVTLFVKDSGHWRESQWYLAEQTPLKNSVP